MPGIINKNNSHKAISINALLEATEANWYTFFDRIGGLITDYSQSTDASNKENRRSIFFRFLKEAFSTEAIKTLTDEQKETLFSLAENELTDNTYDLTTSDGLKSVYERFTLFLKVKHQGWDEKVLSLIVMYAKKIVNVSIVLDENIDQLHWNFINFFWILNVNFSNYAKIKKDYLSFKKVFDPFEKMNNEIHRWDQNSIFSFRTVLGTYRILRTHFKDNSEIGNFLDKRTKSYLSTIIDLTEHQCFSLTTDEIKECAYIEYVNRLSDIEKNVFTNLYRKIDKHDVFPNQYTYQYAAFNITIYYQEAPEKKIINEAIYKTFLRVQGLATTLGIDFKRPVEDQTFKLYIFKTNEAYIKYGSLWGINTAGGGYAHVRLPSDNDIFLNDFNAFSDKEEWHETFIYQQKGDTRNKASKEGGHFRNLGHEIQHSLFYALIGRQGLNCLPSWMVEGAANALGNEDCFKEEADYIKSFKKRLPSIARITNMSYSSGGDLYYFGSALFRFILKEKPNFLAEIIKKAQNDESIHTINQFIKEGLKSDEAAFKSWLNRTIDTCSVVGKPHHINRTTINDVQIQYKKDLSNNKELSKFLWDRTIQFAFNDTMFRLTRDAISRSDTDVFKTVQKISISDYDWFKSALEIYTLDNKLTNLEIAQKKDSIIEALVDSKKEQLIARKIVAIYINDSEVAPEFKEKLNQFIENFVLEKSFNLSKNLKKFFEQQGEISSNALTKILSFQQSRESSCNVYLRKQLFSSVDILSDAPSKPIEVNKAVSTLYQRSLNKNKALKKLIQQFGRIKFTFSDTVFVLSRDDLSRYTPVRKTPQWITEEDFRWFESALEIYSIKNYLRKKSLDYDEKSIAELLNVEIDYVSNRWISDIFPNENDCFHFIMKEFILSLERSEVLKKRLNQLDNSLRSHHGSVNHTLAINATSALGALTLFISNASLVLNSLLSKPKEITHVRDDSCDENNSDVNSSHWLMLAGGISVVAVLIIAKLSFWYCKRKKENDIPSMSLERALSSEIEKLQACQTRLSALKKAIKREVSKDAYTILKVEFSTIDNNIEILIIKNREGLNPNTIFNEDKASYEEYQTLFVDVLDLLKKIKKNLCELKLYSLYSEANGLLVELRSTRPLPQFNNGSASHKARSMTIEAEPLIRPSHNNRTKKSKQADNRETVCDRPGFFSGFKKTLSVFELERGSGLDFPDPPSAEELKKRIPDQYNENDRKQRVEAPIYANISMGRN